MADYKKLCEDVDRYVSTNKALIAGLEKENALRVKLIDLLQSENARLKKEHNVALGCFPHTCKYCYFGNRKILSDGRIDDLCRTCMRNKRCNWKWRGVSPDEEG